MAGSEVNGDMAKAGQVGVREKCDLCPVVSFLFLSLTPPFLCKCMGRWGKKEGCLVLCGAVQITLRRGRSRGRTANGRGGS